MKCLLFLLFVCLAVHSGYAQQQRPWEELLEEMAGDEDYENDALLDYYEELNELENNPININTATEEDLMRLPFLTDQQRMDISEYLYRYGRMLTLGELSMITSLDAQQIKLLRCFLYAGEKADADTLSLRTIIRRGKHDLTATAKIPLYERKGDRNGYLGYKYKHWLRYDFSSSGRLRFGLVAAQDAGEPFLSAGNNWGYDHYALYVQRQKWGIAENIVLGHYRVSVGKGLVVNTGTSFGKSAMMAGLNRQQTVVKPHSSRMSGRYMQGAAATLRISKSLALTAYASYRAVDATLNDDGTAATIVTSGYHRTITEMKKKNNTHLTDVGMSISYDKGTLHLGATAAYTHLDRMLKPNTKTVYRRYYPAGNSFTNASVDYGWRIGRLALSGETAIDKQGAVATLNMARMNMAGSLTLTAVQRYYSRGYQSLRASSFADGGRVQNENGVFVAADWKPVRGLTLTAYSDYAYFEWPKYLVSQSSASWDNVLAATYNSGDWTIGGRYRMRQRQRDNEEKNGLTGRTEHRAHLSVKYKWTEQWTTTTRADMAVACYDGGSRGYMLGQTIGYKGKWLTAGASVRYFRTDDYNSRLYAYEGGLYHTFGSALCYGHGMRYSMHARAELMDRLKMTVRLTVANRFDTSTTGSGLQMVDGSSLTDIDLQLNWKL